ncbi:hypothetical protein [Acinetobacter ursingii]|uniref:Uncharacterized protein n=1 Tax=Acinetobacter ursingii TaxID=108980 RepID=A0AA46NQZ8_9GAMM|nr:hypothetical protein [Acinetobacter ursingii]UYF72049.1 hypothetical protein LSO60_01810 [Acinetobacter ursingii]
MTSLSIQDHESLLQVVYMTMGLSFIASFFIYVLLRNTVLSIIKRINFPHRVKTEQGYIYRSLNGTYVTKLRADEIFIQRKMKKRQFWIKRHEYILKRLNSD